MISAANLGQECLLINQDKNQNKKRIPDKTDRCAFFRGSRGEVMISF
jgi:hypothetical protein